MIIFLTHQNDLAINPQMKKALLTTQLKQATENNEKYKNTIWCYLALVLNSTGLMLIRHDCVDHKRLSDGQLLQERFRSNKIVTVVSLMRQLARLKLKEDKAPHNYFIRAKELSTQENTCHSHYSMQMYSVVYLSSTSISWCRKASTPLAALLNWGQDSATMKKTACTRRKWQFTCGDGIQAR